MNLESIHKMSMGNWERKVSSKQAGCFFCGGIYSAEKVREYVEELDGRKTALCPCCDTDAVIFDADAEISEDLLLRLQHSCFIESVDE